MENYISLNGGKIELTQEQVAKMQEILNINQVALSDVPAGDDFKIGKYAFVVLEHAQETTAVILKGLLHGERQFGKNNNFAGSYADDICGEFAEEIAGIIGEENIVAHTVDLTSDDGLKDYGVIERRMSLLTTDLYRRYVETLDKHKLDKWWWLATAYSTPTHDESDWVKCVSPLGYVGGDCYYGNCGVRPFCILKSNIFVSK